MRPTGGVPHLTTRPLHLIIVLAAAPTVLPVWEFQLGWKRDPKPSPPQKLSLATATSAVG